VDIVSTASNTSAFATLFVFFLDITLFFNF